MKGVGVVLLLFCVGLLVPFGSSSLLELEDYPISLYYRDSRLSSVLWFRPPYCLYELWATETLESSLAIRQTATIETQVKLAGDNSVYKATQRFPVPICSPTVAQSLALGDHAYEMGPALACLNDTCIRAVLPGRKYSIKFLLYNQEQTVLAATGWSRHFRTRGGSSGKRDIDCAACGYFLMRGLSPFFEPVGTSGILTLVVGPTTKDMPHDFHTMDADFGSHSPEMVVITALASTAMFLLLAAAGLALIVRPL